MQCSGTQNWFTPDTLLLITSIQQLTVEALLVFSGGSVTLLPESSWQNKGSDQYWTLHSSLTVCLLSPIWDGLFEQTGTQKWRNSSVLTCSHSTPSFVCEKETAISGFVKIVKLWQTKERGICAQTNTKKKIKTCLAVSVLKILQKTGGII